METEKKKQFSLSLAIRIFLAVLVVLSVGVLATSIMKYNQQKEERRELEKKLEQYEELMAALEKESASSEKLKSLLEEYKTYKRLKEESADLAMIREQSERIATLLEDPETKEYLVKLARENGLAYPDETIYYID